MKLWPAALLKSDAQKRDRRQREQSPGVTGSNPRAGKLFGFGDSSDSDESDGDDDGLFNPSNWQTGLENVRKCLRIDEDALKTTTRSKCLDIIEQRKDLDCVAAQITPKAVCDRFKKDGDSDSKTNPAPGNTQQGDAQPTREASTGSNHGGNGNGQPGGNASSAPPIPTRTSPNTDTPTLATAQTETSATFQVPPSSNQSDGATVISPTDSSQIASVTISGVGTDHTSVPIEVITAMTVESTASPMINANFSSSLAPSTTVMQSGLPDSPSDSPTSKPGPNPGTIVASATVGGVVGLLAILFGLTFCYRKRQQATRRKRQRVFREFWDRVMHPAPQEDTRHMEERTRDPSILDIPVIRPWHRPFRPTHAQNRSLAREDRHRHSPSLQTDITGDSGDMTANLRSSLFSDEEESRLESVTSGDTPPASSAGPTTPRVKRHSEPVTPAMISEREQLSRRENLGEEEVMQIGPYGSLDRTVGKVMQR